MTQREYDIVVFGATGFTGGLAAEYLAAHVPEGCRWALAGRNTTKLEAVRERLAAIEPSCADLPLVQADVTDPASLARVAESARVVVTTVGPYLEYGEPLVAACAEAGTDYVDLTGEPEFVDRMYLAHHETARRTGARIVHACGFDSIPYDLGVFFTVTQLGEAAKDADVTVRAQIRANAEFSGGTYASALTAFSRARQMAAVAKRRRAAEPWPADRAIHTPLGPPTHDAETGRWLVPMPTLDPQVVGRSAAAMPRYGRRFTYHQAAAMKRLTTLVATGAGLGVVAVAAQIPPLRTALGKLRKPGDGPSAQRRARSWFQVRFTGEAGGERVVTEFAGGDPGYDETAKMLSESALCLAFDDVPQTSGQVTTAVAMGEPLVERLQNAGMRIRVLDE